jgi:hypothetical protein
MRIVAGTGYPGGVSAIGPALRMLTDREGVDLVVTGTDATGDSLRALGLAVEQGYPSDPLSGSPASEPVDAVVCGLIGEKTGYDYTLFRAARDRDIPVVAVLDAWMNLADRFTNEDGTSFSYVPDALAVMDETTRLELIETGLPGEILHVTGHGAFGELKAKLRHGEWLRESVRERLGVKENQTLVVFFSEPLRMVDYQWPKLSAGYDEFAAIDLLLDGLKRSCVQACLTVREHPRMQSLGSYPHERAKANDHLDLIQAEGSFWNPTDLLIAADVVAGMSTSVLVQAAVLGKSTLCIQPGLIAGMDRNVLTRRGLLPNLERPGDIARILEQGPPDPDKIATLRTHFAWELDSPGSVAELILATATGRPYKAVYDSTASLSEEI